MHLIVSGLFFDLLRNCLIKTQNIANCSYRPQIKAVSRRPQKN